MLIFQILTFWDQIVIDFWSHCSKFVLLFITKMKSSDQEPLKTPKSLKINLVTAENHRFENPAMNYTIYVLSANWRDFHIALF